MSSDSGKAAPKINRLSRQKSVMIVEANPLETGEAGAGLVPGLKVENLNHATLITIEEFKMMQSKLESFNDNEALLKYLEAAKNPFLFTSDHLSVMIDVTTSIRTKIGIISLIGPRLIDPKAKIMYFIGLFRYSEEKSAVEEVLKARAHALTTSMFTRRDGIRSFGGRSSGGRNPLEGGGRGGSLGRGTRSANWHPVQKPNNYGLSPSRRVRPTPSDDSIENNTKPTVFGFDAVLSAIDEPVIRKKSSNKSLDTIKEAQSGYIQGEDGEEDEEEDDHDIQYDHHLMKSNESAISALSDPLVEGEEGEENENEQG